MAAIAGAGSWEAVPWVRAWPWLLATVAAHAVYWPAISRAYETGELGDGYPLMRGGSALLAGMGGVLWFHEVVGWTGWAGIVAVGAGLFLLSWRGSMGRERLTALGAAVLAITAYSLVDSQAARFVPPLPYMAVIGLGSAAVLWPWARLEQPWPERRAFLPGLMTAASYTVFLIAYPLAPLGPLLALRQVAPALAPVVGCRRLQEAWSTRRAAGAVLVALGAAALVWGPLH